MRSIGTTLNKHYVISGGVQYISAFVMELRMRIKYRTKKNDKLLNKIRILQADKELLINENKSLKHANEQMNEQIKAFNDRIDKLESDLNESIEKAKEEQRRYNDAAKSMKQLREDYSKQMENFLRRLR